MSEQNADWLRENQEYLTLALSRPRTALQRYVRSRRGFVYRATHRTPKTKTTTEVLAARAAAMSQIPALEHVVTAFGLSDFDRDLLLLCAGVELEGAFADLCKRALAGKADGPNFSLALASLDAAHWSALSPESPLRSWRLLRPVGGDDLVSGRLRIDEQVLHYLAGVTVLNERLRELVEPRTPPGSLPESHGEVADRLAAGIKPTAGGSWRAVQVCGHPDAGLYDVIGYACGSHSLNLYALQASDLPAGVAERDNLARTWQREARLTRSALMLVVDGYETPETLRAAAAFVQAQPHNIIVAGADPLLNGEASLPRFDVVGPTAEEQRILWRRNLGSLAMIVDEQVDEVVAQFNLGAAGIARASAIAQDAYPPVLEKDKPYVLWDAARTHSRARLDDLAQRIETKAGWGDLVVPPLQERVLHDIISQVKQRSRVYHDWHFADKGTRGFGISVLLDGPSGTGKTLTAEVLANELRLDLYEIDLSQVVSKYIGETEKNLRRVFDAAESAGAVLLFNEADALFGRRSEVKDSHDRHANIEVSYLLQRMEAYNGLAILTTNQKQALDPAFTRRISFIVHYDFPTARDRAEIWRRMFPEEAPKAELDYDRLARLNVAGGNIRNIALGAAFLAAEEGRPIDMQHLLQAARSEYYKLERPLTDAEVIDWVKT